MDMDMDMGTTPQKKRCHCHLSGAAPSCIRQRDHHSCPDVYEGHAPWAVTGSCRRYSVAWVMAQDTGHRMKKVESGIKHLCTSRTPAHV